MKYIGTLLNIHLFIGLITGLYYVLSKNYEEALEQALRDNPRPYDNFFRNKLVVLSLFILMGVFTFPTIFLKKLLKK